MSCSKLQAPSRDKPSLFAIGPTLSPHRSRCARSMLPYLRKLGVAPTSGSLTHEVDAHRARVHVARKSPKKYGHLEHRTPPPLIGSICSTRNSYSTSCWPSWAARLGRQMGLMHRRVTYLAGLWHQLPSAAPVRSVSVARRRLRHPELLQNRLAAGHVWRSDFTSPAKWREELDVSAHSSAMVAC